MPRRYILSFLIATLVFAGAAQAQWQLTWGPIGFNFGRVQCYAQIGSTYFAGTYGDGVWKSTDDSMSDYVKVSDGLAGKNITALLAEGTRLFAASDSGLFVSTDQGASWSEVGTGITSNGVSSLARAGSKLYVAGAGTSVSTDGGVSWNKAADGNLTYPYIGSLAVVGTEIFAGTTGGGIFRSTNDGSTWEPVNDGLPDNNVFRLGSADSYLYAFAGTIPNTQVLRSSNRGDGWTPVMSGLPSFFDVYFQSSGWDMFAGVGSSGVYRITNSDTAWVAVNDGFGGARTVSGLGILGGDLFAALFSANVYRRALSQIVTAVGPVGGDLPSAHSLDQNYPNPFNPSTTISFTVPAREFVTLKVFDVYGREVATLVSGEIGPGGHAAEWKAEGAASGVYYARLQSATFTQTRKLLLMK